MSATILKRDNKHAVIVAAGTGGHIMPGLAVARELAARGWTVSWIGTETGMENQLVPQAGIELDKLAFLGMRGKGPMHFLTGLWRFVGAMGKAFGVLRRRKPAVVFGTGGYVCVPVGWMASLLRRPMVLLNSDASALMSIRMLSPCASRIAFGFPGDYAKYGKRGVWTGNPIRAEVAALPAPAERAGARSGPLRVMVVGGSLGAMVLNETVPKALARIAPDARPYVVHQAGERHIDLVRAAYSESNVDANVVPFIDDMAGCYAEADVVICRAGAITVSELCAGGVPSILVPLTVSTTSHQVHNAKFMAQSGAAVHVPQSELTPERLAEALHLLTRERLVEMGERARALARPSATASVVELIEGVAR